MTTRQREMYEDVQRQMEERLTKVHDAAAQLVQRAAEFGVILTIDTIPAPSSLPAMGNYALRIDVRVGREVYQFLDALEKAAIASEQPVEEQPAEPIDPTEPVDSIERTHQTSDPVAPRSRY